jgi:hypothetical protein
MLSFNGWHLVKLVAALLFILGMSWLALDYFVPAPPSKFTIATGAKDQTYEAIAKRYRDILARSGAAPLAARSAKLQRAHPS